MMSYAAVGWAHLSSSLGLIFLSSLALCLVLERLCSRYGLVDRPSTRKTQIKPVPRFGGFAFVLTSLAAFLGSGAIPPYFLIALVLIYGGGLYDDWFDANTLILKFVFQIPAALYFAINVDLTTVLPNVETTIALRILIFCALFFMTNAANLMDNMNGLTAGLSTLILLCLSTVASTLRLPGLSFAGLALSAALLGFLIRNYPRAHIYMGDQGSQFLGFFTTGYFVLLMSHLKNQPLTPLETLQIASSLVILFGLYFYDVVTVVRIRLREKRSPFKGDRCHISHRLTDRGWHPALAVLFLFVIQFGLALVAGAWINRLI